MSGEYGDYNSERFGGSRELSGKNLDEELDHEEELDKISSEDLASDFKTALAEIGSKIPREFSASISKVIETIEFYHNEKVTDWQEDVIEPLTTLVENLDMASPDEIIDREEEFVNDLTEIVKAADRLKAKKVN